MSLLSPASDTIFLHRRQLFRRCDNTNFFMDVIKKADKMYNLFVGCSYFLPCAKTFSPNTLKMHSTKLFSIVTNPMCAWMFACDLFCDKPPSCRCLSKYHMALSWRNGDNVSEKRKKKQQTAMAFLRHKKKPPKWCWQFIEVCEERTTT